jgi:4,5-dihydroxyphthalate decarboxylase
VNKIPLTLAVSDYDHVRDIVNGRVRVQGVDLTCIELPVEEIFFRFVKYREWQISEFSMGKYVAMRAAGDDSITAIPVFPSRMFRHSSIFVRRDGPTTPADLAGRRVGVPEWAQTASIYTRGLLSSEYGVPLTAIQWYQAGLNQPGREEKVAVSLPSGVHLSRVTERSLDGMLLAGDLDAVLSARPPRSFQQKDPRVRRLIEDYASIEREYFYRTAIFPIMHVVAIRSDVLADSPWIAMNLFDAFEEAKQRSIDRLRSATISSIPVPWLAGLIDDLSVPGGGQWWPYGVERNRRTIEAFLGYAYEQGVASRLLEAEDLFVPESAAYYRV